MPIRLWQLRSQGSWWIFFKFELWTHDALGMIETREFAAMIEATDTMVKAAEVDLVGYEKIADGNCEGRWDRMPCGCRCGPAICREGCRSGGRGTGVRRLLKLMDQNQLVQKIDEEVLSRKNASTVNSTSGDGISPNSVSTAAKPAVPKETFLPSDLPKYIDHTLLKPEASEEQIDALCDEAAKYHFYSVCVNSSWVEHCVRRLDGTGVKTCAVVGFPLGAMDLRAKGFEAETAVSCGADEIDMVMNIGAMKTKDIKTVREDMLAVRRACRQGIILKVIIEACLLTDEEKVLACQIAKDIGADFVKTSTGFSKGGATVADVALMRRTVGPKMGVKAAGGIKSFEDAVQMLKAGATRLGTSSGVALVTGKKSASNY